LGRKGRPPKAAKDTRQPPPPMVSGQDGNRG
jgi:hypothetical protein